MPHCWIPKHDAGLHVAELKGFDTPRFHAIYITDCYHGRDGGMAYTAVDTCPIGAASRALGMIPARCECPACGMAQDEHDHQTGEAFRGLRLVGAGE